MSPPTAPDTGAIRQRLEKITPGPWEAEWTPMGKGYTRIIGGIDGDAYDDGSPRTISTHVCDVIDNADEEANLDFIAHAPADIAALLADNQRLREALEKAAPHVCENLCPSKWRTADGPPPHHETCRQITDAFKAKEGDTP